MAVFAECPECHLKQSLRNKSCSCGCDLDKAKKAKEKVLYWINYRTPKGSRINEHGGKEYLYELHWEKVGYFISEARDADGKRKVQKRENRIFDIKPEMRMTFQQLTDWYLGLEEMRSLSYYWVLQIRLSKFNSEICQTEDKAKIKFGDMVVSDIKPYHLGNLQAKWKKEGKAESTIDQGIGAVRGMVNKAFDNDLVGGETLKVFKKVKKVLKRNSNARKRILSLEEFNNLYQHLPLHAKSALAIGFYTGMRRGEVLELTWDKLSLPNRVIRLEAADTKDKEPREIPICDELCSILKRIPRSLQDNHVILYNGKPIKGYLYGGLKEACKKAGILYGRFTKDGFIYHDLRHSFNTYMRKAGVDTSVIMEITGHSTLEMFNRYNTVDEEDRKQAVSRFEGFLKTQPKEKTPQSEAL